jgi:hypothetical protein
MTRIPQTLFVVLFVAIVSTADLFADEWEITEKMVDKYEKTIDRSTARSLWTNTSRLPEPQKACSRVCVCSEAGMLPYGRSCGWGYGACDGTVPCNELDACCKTHDYCTAKHGLEDESCTVALTKCAQCALTRMRRGLSTSSWKCDKSIQAALRIIADIKFLIPQYYSRAKYESIEAAALSGSSCG